MPNPDIAALIARGLQQGLPHPGRPETDEAARMITPVAFRTTGMPAEMRDHVNNTALAMGEAIVNLIETTGNSAIVANADMAKLRADDLGPGAPLPVICRSCDNRIMSLRVINGRAIVAGQLLANVNLNCPHNMEATP